MPDENIIKAAKHYTTTDPQILSLSRRTTESRRRHVCRLLSFLTDRSLTLEAAKEYITLYTSKKIAESTKRCEAKLLRAFINYCYRNKYILYNFASEIPMPKVHYKPIECLPADTCEKIIIEGTKEGIGDNSRNRRIKKDVRLGLRFALRTGLRISELLKLKGTDLRFNDNPPSFIVHSKGGNVDMLPLPRDLINQLKERERADPLFDITDKTCNRSLQRGAKRLAIYVHVHNHLLRHSFATTLLRSGKSPALVQRLMRHRSFEITNKTYSHYIMSDLSNTLNSLLIIKEGLHISEVFDAIENIVKTQVQNDSRIELLVERKKEFILLKIKSNEVV